jgi:hypothetical protein
VQLCYLRFPGIFLGVDDPPFLPLLRMVAAQLKVPVEAGTITASASRHGGSTWSSCKRCLDSSPSP